MNSPVDGKRNAWLQIGLGKLENALSDLTGAINWFDAAGIISPPWRDWLRDVKAQASTLSISARQVLTNKRSRAKSSLNVAPKKRAAQKRSTKHGTR